MNTSNCFTSDLIEVFATKHGIVYQSDRERALFVDFGGKIAKYNFSCLNRLRKAINSKDIESMIIDISRPNFELITVSSCDHCYLLSALDILSFKELLDGTFVMFDLNNILKDRLSRVEV
ncbi:hypothetical protein [Pedobacter flavus]|uniref:Uncharacterized protein n=1 Tax=Pedobacter flavus TaxID=3113906 RepID=A0ABU7GYR7_9SPHI|nr:hypothetical protein [Pedobacter sp. VNH31]MEE1884100.1 hypothetical protein [Pedobacter sp. VNH31]